METTTSCGGGSWNRPGYPSPLSAMQNGPREELAYVTCVSARWQDTKQPDFLATIDVNPSSSTYSRIIHKLPMTNLGDELHHTNWNVCSSCKDCNAQRNKLVLPCLNSDRIYVVDTGIDPKAPQMFKVIEPKELHEKVKASTPHTVHCTPAGFVQISCMGDENKEAKGTFLLLDQKTFDVVGTWQKKEEDYSEFGYDFWYQPRQNVMVSSEWAAPKTFSKGFRIEDFKNGLYGHSITFWNWKERKQIKRLDLGEKGQIPLEIRFLHNPDSSEGYVGCALSTTIFRFYKKDEDWSADCVVTVPVKKVKNWMLPEMPGLITDIIISLDDRFLYFSNWLHGDVRQYDISNPKSPRLVGQIFLGGLICSDKNVEVIEDLELEKQPTRPKVKGVPVRGGPQMLQLSLDGKRMYVTNSLYSVWDEQFYPENISQGSLMLLLNVDVENGGLTLDENFLVDFGSEGNVLAHEIRFPGGDSSSDIWD